MPFEPQDLKLSSYRYHLPPHLVASRPLEDRSKCRLMVYNVTTGQVEHSFFHQLHQFLPPDTLLVLNNSQVIPTRFLARKGNTSEGGKAEIFVHAPQSERPSEGGFCVEVMIRARGKKKVGDIFTLEGANIHVRILELLGDSFRVEFAAPSLAALAAKWGKIPLPCYIREGISDQQDLEDYQTVFASHPGSVAAPTAGLHFTRDYLQRFQHAFVTLHVGAGTFLPVKTEDILNHHMHRENFSIAKEEWSKIIAAKKLIAVGTTTLRTLESLYNVENKQLHYPEGSSWQQTDIFLHPGKEIHSVQGLITNFHWPESSLLMLVSAIIGRKKALELYEEAVKREYRFFSYGDAMLIIR